jgi:chitinase
MKSESLLSITFCVVSFLIALGCDQRTVNSSLQSSTEPEVIAYYSGGKDAIDQYDLRGVSQLIYSFLHLKGNELGIDNASDSLTLMHLTGLKSNTPN